MYQVDNRYLVLVLLLLLSAVMLIGGLVVIISDEPFTYRGDQVEGAGKQAMGVLYILMSLTFSCVAIYQFKSRK